MKKRILSVLLTGALLLSGVALFSSCGDDAHSHHFAGTWSKDDSFHWFACTDEGCDAKAAQSAHTLDEGTVITPATPERDGQKAYKCKVCGHTFTKAYSLAATKNEVSATEWAAALSADAFRNVTLGYTISLKQGDSTTLTDMREERTENWVKLSMKNAGTWYELSTNETPNAIGDESVISKLLAYGSRFADFTFQDLANEYTYKTDIEGGTLKVVVAFSGKNVVSATITTEKPSVTETITYTFSHYEFTEVVATLRVTDSEWRSAMALSSFGNINFEELTLSVPQGTVTRKLFKVLGGTLRSLTEGASSSYNTYGKMLDALASQKSLFTYDAASGCYIARNIRVQTSAEENSLVPTLCVHFRYGSFYKLEFLSEQGDLFYQLLAYNKHDTETVAQSTCKHQWLVTDSFELCVDCLLPFASFAEPTLSANKTYTGTYNGAEASLTIYSDYACASLNGVLMPVRVIGNAVQLMRENEWLLLTPATKTFSCDFAPIGAVNYTCEKATADGKAVTTVYQSGIVQLSQLSAQGEELDRSYGHLLSSLRGLLLVEVDGDLLLYATRNGTIVPLG